MGCVKTYYIYIDWLIDDIAIFGGMNIIPGKL